MKTVKALTRYI